MAFTQKIIQGQNKLSFNRETLIKLFEWYLNIHYLRAGENNFVKVKVDDVIFRGDTYVFGPEEGGIVKVPAKTTAKAKKSETIPLQKREDRFLDVIYSPKCEEK
jgi:tRNA(Leu) C34 or U34 (ribose-2'-O)-methylase TrmL